MIDETIYEEYGNRECGEGESGNRECGDRECVAPRAYKGRQYKTAVEYVRNIDVRQLNRDGILDAPPGTPFGWEWTKAGKITMNAVLVPDEDLDGDEALWLHHVSSGGEELIAYPVKITSIRPNYGGRKRYFLCPLQKGEEPCLQRVEFLYNLSPESMFGCRHCLGLIFESRKKKGDPFYESVGKHCRKAQRARRKLSWAKTRSEQERCRDTIREAVDVMNRRTASIMNHNPFLDSLFGGERGD